MTFCFLVAFFFTNNISKNINKTVCFGYGNGAGSFVLLLGRVTSDEIKNNCFILKALKTKITGDQNSVIKSEEKKLGYIGFVRLG